MTHEARPWMEIPQYSHPDIAPAERCAAFGSTSRPKTKDFRVIDAIIFSIELDLLEIRLIELWSYIDVFLILEGNVTFTGLPKPMIFQEHRERFARAKAKIVYRDIANLTTGESKEVREGSTNEAATRQVITNLLRDTIHAADSDLIMESDVEEIPSASNISLLRSCE
jgi:beta-1,4-mannosyl-glycoprotein beta-1,4-N-acetylglucosaminyltransferase